MYNFFNNCMDLRVKQSKIILKNYLFFASKYICCYFTLDAKNIFENEFYSRMYVKKIEKWRIIDENNAFSTIVSREKGIYRYNDAIWRKYRNYTISFLTTRQFKRRISNDPIIDPIDIYIPNLLYRSIIRSSSYYTSSLYR